MNSNLIWFYRILLFLVVLSCLPLPHGNVYPFVILILGSLFPPYKITYTNQFSMKDQILSANSMMLIIFFLWAGLSCLWAAKHLSALGMWGKNGVIFLGGLVWGFRYVSLENIKPLEKSVKLASILLFIALTIFALDIKFNGKLYKMIDQHISQALVHGCVACALSIWLWMKDLNKLRQAAILISLVWSLQVCSSDAAALGLILGSGALVLNKLAPIFLRSMFIYGMPTVWLALPFVFRLFTTEQFYKWGEILEPSYTHRLFIWDSVSTQIFERFWAGFGIGSSRYRDFFVNVGDITLVKSGQKIIFGAAENCLHPHNFMLQIWLELGAVGVILTCIAWILYWKKNYHQSNPYAIAFWGSALSVAATGISIWQSWWLILFITLLPVYKKLR